uniref:Beta-lactamase-related domain-containing protein n=1 Tax=Haptolina ericina TaxID=156174 RepID=A0A7S3BUN8_9EUKA|mmetsp:Transcript_66614/g.148678  ORF Transcript_66614/g.148678 Transcript_66614/m.148678 type:complete len:412 (+) Transcript_66614:44-1279(+)
MLAATSTTVIPPQVDAARIQAAFTESAATFGVVGMAWRVETGGVSIDGRVGHTSSDEGASSLSADQAWHWGSCTKALTASVIGALVEERRIAWTTRVADHLLTLSKGSALSSATVLELLHHRAGVVTDLDPEEELALAAEAAAVDASPTDQRRSFVAVLAAKPCSHPAGDNYGPYSNAGYVVLAALVEAVTGDAWERTVLRWAAGLGLTSLGFGGRPGGAVGRGEEGEPDKGDYAWHASSFSVHSTLADWATFVRAHLHAAQARGDGTAGASMRAASALAVGCSASGDNDTATSLATPLGLKLSTVRILHTPASPAVDGERFDGPEAPMGYACGWKSVWEDAEESARALTAPTGLLWHWGTNFRWNAGAFLDAPRDLLIVCGANCGSMMTRLAMKTAFDEVIIAACGTPRK